MTRKVPGAAFGRSLPTAGSRSVAGRYARPVEASSAMVRALFAVVTVASTCGLGASAMTVSVPSAPDGISATWRRSSNTAPSGRLPMGSEATVLPAAFSTTATPFAQAETVSFVAAS